MPSTPTTKSQVQAYRFVLRRMESALVRKDPVMLHDPMRSHKRATIVGVLLAVVAMAGFTIVGVLSPAPTVPTSGIVIAQPSGQIYVVNQSPRQLIPVFNLASARLLIYAEQQSGQQGAASGANNSVPQAQGVTTVDDSELKGFPMGRLTGIQDGPQILPTPGNATTDWAVCDDIPRIATAPDPTAGQQPNSVVLVGERNIGTELGEDEALLVSGQDGNTYLIYHRPHGNINNPDDSTVRARVDLTDPHVKTALGLDTMTPRPISDALLNAIPQVGEIRNPIAAANIRTGGSLAGFPVPIGQSFVASTAGAPEYYVVLPDGIQSVSQTVAQIVLDENGTESQMPSVVPYQLANVQPVAGDELKVADYPDGRPQVFNSETKNVMCLGWTVDNSDPQNPIARTRVTVDTQLHLPADPTGPNGQMAMNKIGQPDPSGDKIDYFFMDPQYQGIAVRAASNAKEFDTGPIYIVTGRGAKYSVQNLQIAQVLGVANGASPGYGMVAAPESILRLLPSSSETLNTQNVQRTFDTVPIPETAGTYVSVTNGQQAAAGG